MFDGDFTNFRVLEETSILGARLLREKRVQGRPHRRIGAEGGPPSESECLERRSNFRA
jgi:hypothetical protein